MYVYWCTCICVRTSVYVHLCTCICVRVLVIIVTISVVCCYECAAQLILWQELWTLSPRLNGPFLLLPWRCYHDYNNYYCEYYYFYNATSVIHDYIFVYHTDSDH